MKGLSIALCGQANDYVGKGLSGGIISICKDPRFDGKACENILAGNTCLYGATSGELYLCGVAGERFGVRNSGARAVCEGLGDHGCEYMTGGTVVVLGRIGRNFGAGMSGGVAYLYDPEHKARARLSEEAFIVTELTDAAHADPLTPLHEGRQDEELLHELIAKHQELTASMRARAILEHWNEELPHFLKIIPTEYFNALKALEGR